MIDILHTILTDATVRDSKAVEARLSADSAAGTPWFDAA